MGLEWEVPEWERSNDMAVTPSCLPCAVLANQLCSQHSLELLDLDFGSRVSINIHEEAVGHCNAKQEIGDVFVKFPAL